MRENNHIMNRHKPSHQDMSSYKIRPPLDQRSPLRRENLTHVIKDTSSTQKRVHYVSSFNQPHRLNQQKDSSISSFYQKKGYQRNESRQNSRDLSFNSRGSNGTKNSIKMTDYIALQAKNLILNRDKYRYEKHERNDEKQNHMRSSSMHCYPSSFKMTRGMVDRNEKGYDYVNSMKEATDTQQQPTDIPSFGIQCRTTSGSVNNNSPYHLHNHHAITQKSTSLSKYPTYTYKVQEPSTASITSPSYPYPLQTQISDRLDRLRTSSTSTRHRQRLSNIKRIDESRLKDMDKINVKIRSILCTLEREEDHYRRRFVGEGGERRRERVKTEGWRVEQKEGSREGSDCGDYCDGGSDGQVEEESLLSKYTGHHCNNNNNMNNNYSQHQRHSDQSPQYCDKNVSSYYYYEDQSAMMKSSQSPIRSSPQSCFKKGSVQKGNEERSLSKYSKYSRGSVVEVGDKKHVPNVNESTKPSRLVHESQCYNNNSSTNFSQSRHPYRVDPTNTLLSNIPQCQTQIIESKAFQITSSNPNTNRNPLIDAYHTFDTKMSQANHKNFTTQSTHKDQFNMRGSHWNDQQENYRTPQLNQLGEYYYDGYKDERGSMNRQGQFYGGLAEGHGFGKSKLSFDGMEAGNKSSKRAQKEVEENKKNQSIYFKLDDQSRYRRSTQKSKQCFDQLYLNPNHHPDNNPSSFTYSKPQDNPVTSPFLPHRHHIHELTFDQRKKDYIYSDSIKQTPIIQHPKPCEKKDDNIFVRRNSSYVRESGVGKGVVEDDRKKGDMELDGKLREYEQRLEKYQKGLEMSNILGESQRGRQTDRSGSNTNKRDMSCGFVNSDGKYSHKDQLYNVNAKEQRIVKEANNNASKRTSKQQLYEPMSHNQSRGEPSTYHLSTPPKHSPRQSHRFHKQDHQQFIENLRKDRQQVAQLSQRKSRLDKNSCVSVDYSRVQASNQRSQSQNSKLSSNTIIKGKNIDEEISKIQKKMQEYQVMKKELHLESQENTQRSVKNLVAREEPKTEAYIRKTEYGNGSRSPKRQKSVRFDEKISLSEVKPVNSSSNTKSREILKIVEQKNSFVKVRNSILRQQKTNEIKSYLDDSIQRESNRSRSISQRKDISLTKSRHLPPSKENILPPTTTTIDSPKYPHGGKKVVLGLAQNLVLNSLSETNNIKQQQVPSKTDINTPKLLRNLKNKLSDKSIVKKKAQKRGFRSQFINDLHQDNEVISSATRITPTDNICQQQNHSTQSTSSQYIPQNRQLLTKILHMFQTQILMDEKFRNEKKMFNSITKMDKWTLLMAEYQRQVPDERNVMLSRIVELFTLSQEESNPFYSTRGVQFSIPAMVRTYIDCDTHWRHLTQQISSIPPSQLATCKLLNGKSLDIQRKGYIEVEDLTRFINMELNKYYRKRDLWLVWGRVVGGGGGEGKGLGLEGIGERREGKVGLSFEGFLHGVGVRGQGKV